MRIDLMAGIITAETQVDKTGSSRPPAAAAQAPADSEFSAGDAVNLSAKALRAPEVRQDKVEALRAQLLAGTYRASSRQIATSILDGLRANG